MKLPLDSQELIEWLQYKIKLSDIAGATYLKLNDKYLATLHVGKILAYETLIEEIQNAEH